MHLTRLGEAADVALAAVYLASPESAFVTGINLQLDGGSSIARGLHAWDELDAPARVRRARSRRSASRSPTTSRSGTEHGIDQRRGVGREARGARLGRRRRARRRRGRRADSSVVNLIGLGPFHLADPDRWGAQQERLVRAIDAAEAFGAGCLVFTTGPGDAARVGRGGRRARSRARTGARRMPVPRACRSRSSTPTPCGSTSASCTRCATPSTSPAASTPACAWRSTRAGRNATSPRRSPTASTASGSCRSATSASARSRRPDRLVPGDGDIPIRRILGDVLAPGTTGSFDLELIGPRIEAEGYDAVPAIRARRLLDVLELRCRPTSAQADSSELSESRRAHH